MARPVTPLGEFAAEVALALDDDAGARARAIAHARQRFLIQTVYSSRSGWQSGQRIALALLALVMFAFGWLAFPLTPGALAFTVDGKPGLAHTWIAAPSGQTLVVSFSDGTVLQAAPSSRARVVELDSHGADISLESGQIHAHVAHTLHSAWRLSAGPFAIRVTGTRFDVTWEPVSQTFSLAVLEGSVIVSGSIVGNDRPVRAGEKLLASVARGRLELVNAETGAAATKPEPDQAVAPATEPPAVAAVEASAVAREASIKDDEAWRTLAEKGELRQAFAAADARGFRGICSSATASELLLLGDAARISGRSDRATEALLTLRRRYPRDARRAAAAFSLGKVAFDQQHAYAQAAHWFAVYELEQPNGPLAREASGRRIEALRNAGDGPGARKAARDYLARHPQGPHADVARSLITE